MNYYTITIRVNTKHVYQFMQSTVNHFLGLMECMGMTVSFSQVVLNGQVRLKDK